jgi:hypothetical protein
MFGTLESYYLLLYFGLALPYPLTRDITLPVDLSLKDVCRNRRRFTLGMPADDEAAKSFAEANQRRQGQPAWPYGWLVGSLVWFTFSACLKYVDFIFCQS